MVKVLLSVVLVCEVVLSPPTFEFAVAIQVYVEAIELVNGILTVLPLQTDAVFVLVITGKATAVKLIVAVLTQVYVFVAVNVYTVVPATVGVTVGVKVVELVIFVVGDQT